ncbi:OmpA family protein [Acidiphilium sp.]|uniref:OmpA family protein n=1 Tax=Acidiphilium sp. TaxID=527 RepID=UPI00258EAAB9|nr:OmpA family protein [Acidiphilium sp.]
MRFTGVSAAAVVALLGMGAAHAQSSGPSAQQIIQALKPTGNVSSTTRGIVPLAQGAAQAAPAPSVAKPAAMRMKTTAPAAVSHAAAQTPSINLNIDFATGSAKLTPQAVTELDRLGRALTDKPLAAYHFRVVGHTDTTGAASTNLALSQARAAAVKTYLMSKFDIPATRLQATGVGEADLLVPTGPNVANRANRRVQIINTGK